MADVSAPSAQVAVIGCGNLVRSDDGIGPHVVRILGGRRLAADPRVRLLDAGTDGMAVMYAARGCQSLVLIDASRSGATPGAVYEVPGAELENGAQPSLSLHEFRWDHALFAGRRLYGDAFPRDVSVLLIEAADTGYGLELTPPVSRAARAVAERIEALVAERLRQAA
jgi:hydrogenase maturation protease